MKTMKGLIVTLLVIVALTTGCARSTVSAPTTALANVNKTLDGLAISNKAVVDMVVQLQTSGILKEADARLVLVTCDKIAVADKGAVLLINTKDPWPTRVANAEAILNQIVPPANYVAALGLTAAQYSQLLNLINADMTAIDTALQALKTQSKAASATSVPVNGGK